MTNKKKSNKVKDLSAKKNVKGGISSEPVYRQGVQKLTRVRRDGTAGGGPKI